MSTIIDRGRPGGALFGKVRSAVLALLFSRADESFYLREIARRTGRGHGAVQRELARLLRAGLITRSKRGREVYYQANRASPVFSELHRFVLKTVGVADVLREALSSLAQRIRVAFVCGSFAKGEESAKSDVDVMVVGDVGFGEVVSALAPAQDKLGREVNPSVFPPEEWRRRVANADHFVSTLLREEKLFLIGDERNVGELGQLRLAGGSPDQPAGDRGASGDR